MTMRMIRQWHKNEDGQMAFTFILSALFFFILFALALDAGFWYFDHRNAQNQADASALAAVQDLPCSDPCSSAFSDAKTWLTRNGVDQTLPSAPVFQSPPTDPPTCSAVAQNEVRIIFGSQDTQGYEKIRVCLRRTSGKLALFSRLSGKNSVTVSAAATAAVIRVPSVYSVMAMCNTGNQCTGNNCTTLTATGGGTINVSGGGQTYDAATCSGALTVNNNATLISGGNNIVSPGTASGTSYTNIPPVPDPWAYLQQPPAAFGSCKSIPGNLKVSQNVHLTPGTFCSQLSIGNGDKVTLDSTGTKIFIFTNGISVTGTGELTSNDGQVMLYGACKQGPQRLPVACNNSSSVDAFNFSGNVHNMKGLASFDNILFWIDRTSGSPKCSLQINGQGNIALSGNTYAIACDVSVTGGSTVPLTLNMAIVGGTVKLSGGAGLTIPYDITTAPHFLEPALVE